METTSHVPDSEAFKLYYLPVNLNLSILVESSSTSDVGYTIRGEGANAAHLQGKEPIVNATSPWHTMALAMLASLTMYGELSAAHVPEDFVPVRTRLQHEWTFNAGFVSRFTIYLLIDS